MVWHLAFRAGGLTFVFCKGGLGLIDVGECARKQRLVASAPPWPRGGEVRPDLTVVGSTETAPRHNLLLSGGILSTKAAGAETEDQVEWAWSDSDPGSDLELSDLSDLVSARVPEMC